MIQNPIRQSPWLNTEDAAAYLCYTGKQPLRSVYRFIERHGIVVRRDGKRLLIARADVDRAVESGRQAIRLSRQRDQSSQSVHVGNSPTSEASSIR